MQCVTYRICSGVPPEVALAIAHAASLRVLNSALLNISINDGKMFASITAYMIIKHLHLSTLNQLSQHT